MALDGVNAIEIPPNNVVENVHKQLNKNFQPAIKGIADAGGKVLHSFSELQKSFDEYIRAVRVVAGSGKQAQPDVRKRADELEKIASVMQDIQEKHKVNIERFRGLVAKLNVHRSQEKNKLKEICREYKAREKAMKQAVQKGNKENNELEQFYEKEMNLAVNQQHQRYKFFVDNHKDWIRSYAELLDYIKEVADSAETEHKVATSDEEQSEEEEKKSNTEEANKEEHPQSTGRLTQPATEEETGKPTRDQPSEAGDSFLKKNWKVAEEDETEFTSNRIPSSVKDSERDEIQREGENFILQPRQPRTTAPPVIERQRAPSPRIDYPTEGSNAPNVLEPRRKTIQLTYWPSQEEERQGYVNVPAAPQSVLDVLQRLSDQEEPYRQSSSHQTSKQTSNRYSYQEPVPAERKKYSPVSQDRMDGDHPNNQPNGIMFRSANINAIPTAIVPPAFRTSDYGKLLECVHDFNAQNANQLSLGVGERVVLIKCGSKGWVFAKHVESQRTGWFPSRFVQLPQEEFVSL